MGVLEQLFQILLVLLPALAVFLTTYFILKKFFENEERKRMMDVRKETHKTTLPMKLQAHERVVLFLDRISPENLVIRVHKQNESAGKFQADLLQTIRSEFDHNITQQLYISETSWGLVKNAKEETVRMVNIAAGKMKKDSSGTDLAKMVLELVQKMDRLPTHIAIDYLKKDARKIT